MELEAHHRWWKQRGRSLVNAILRDEWNPIGINAPPDEYSGYAGTVGRLLGEGQSEAAIAAFLAEGREHMGLDPDPVADQAVAVRLVSIYPAAGRVGAGRQDGWAKWWRRHGERELR